MGHSHKYVKGGGGRLGVWEKSACARTHGKAFLNFIQTQNLTLSLPIKDKLVVFCEVKQVKII